jgi:hypothetical protein
MVINKPYLWLKYLELSGSILAQIFGRQLRLEGWSKWHIFCEAQIWAITSTSAHSGPRKPMPPSHTPHYFFTHRNEPINDQRRPQPWRQNPQQNNGFRRIKRHPPLTTRRRFEPRMVGAFLWAVVGWLLLLSPSDVLFVARFCAGCHDWSAALWMVFRTPDDSDCCFDSGNRSLFSWLVVASLVFVSGLVVASADLWMVFGTRGAGDTVFDNSNRIRNIFAMAEAIGGDLWLHFYWYSPSSTNILVLCYGCYCVTTSITRGILGLRDSSSRGFVPCSPGRGQIEIPAPTAAFVISITRGESVAGDRCNLVIFIARVEGDGGVVPSLFV